MFPLRAQIQRLATKFRDGVAWDARDVFHVLDVDSKDIRALTACERAHGGCARCGGRVLNTICC